MPIHKSRIFWTLIAGVLAFTAKYFYPAFPLSEAEILAVIVFILSAFNITPELRARGYMPKY